MKTTESQASEKLCPNSSQGSHCVGACCMAWRWSDRVPARLFFQAHAPQAVSEGEAGEKPARADGFDFVPYDDEDGDPAGWHETVEQANARRRGFCGLACRPLSE